MNIFDTEAPTTTAEVPDVPMETDAGAVKSTEENAETADRENGNGDEMEKADENDTPETEKVTVLTRNIRITINHDEKE